MNLSIVANLNELTVKREEIIKKFSLLCEYLKPLGYSGIELSILKPEKIDTQALMEVINSFDMKIPALGTGGTYIRYGYSLGHKKRSIRKEAINRISKYINFAAKSDSKVIIGLIRGRYRHKSSPEKERENIFSSLTKCIELVEDQNVLLALEPINRFEIDSYHTLSNSLGLIEKLDSDNIKLLVDTFHIHLEEDPNSIWDDLRKNVSEICHIHLADCNRRSPGSGHFDFKTFINIFKNADYKGFYSLETIMKPSFEDVAEESAKYLRNIFNE